MNDIKEFLLFFTITILLTFLLLWIFSLLIYPIENIRCNHSYNYTKYDIFSWCMVKYNWKYIPEKLYIKAFEQNINIGNNLIK